MKKTPLRRTSKKKKALAGKELQMYLEIWQERHHLSELSGEPLLPYGDKEWHSQFAHILDKGQFKRWKYNKRNIMLVLPDEHRNQAKYEHFRKVKERLLKEYKQEFYNTYYD